MRKPLGGAAAVTVCREVVRPAAGFASRRPLRPPGGTVPEVNAVVPAAVVVVESLGAVLLPLLGAGAVVAVVVWP